jgi:hypothetical protein
MLSKEKKDDISNETGYLSKHGKLAHQLAPFFREEVPYNHFLKMPY